MMNLFNDLDLQKKFTALKAYLNNNISKAQVISTINQVAQSPFRNHDIDLVVRVIVILAALASIYVSCRRKKALDEKESADINVRALLTLEACRIAEQKTANDKDPYTRERLEAMESKVKQMETDLSYLRNLCPQMNDRKITFGTPDSMWPIPSLGHGDFVMVYYSLLDIIEGNVISSAHAQHLQLTVTGIPVPPTEILLPAGMRIVVTKATRIPRGVRDLENSVDLTSSAKVALESSLTRTYR